MNLPNLPAPPSAINECLKLYAQRLEYGVMPFPRASQLLIAYMAWPNDRTNRDRWMSTNLALFLAEPSLNPVRASREPDNQAHETSPQPRSSDQVAFELFGGLRTVADAALSDMMIKLEGIQKRWPRAADVLQMVVDIHHEKRALIPGGASISKACDVLLGYSALPRKAQLSKDWSDFKDVVHLIAAAAAVASGCIDQTKDQGASAVLTPVLFVPEVILGLGLAFQEFGLGFKPHGWRVSIFPPKTLWRIPKTIKLPLLPLPIRRLSDDDLNFLQTTRRARPKI